MLLVISVVTFDICHPHMLIGMVRIYRLLFVCFSAKVYNRYLQHGLMQANEIWQGGRAR